MCNFKIFIYLIVFYGYSFSYAGSYDDFFIAIKRDDAGAVTTLLNRGFDVNTLNPAGEHGLFLAIREPSLKVAGVLINWSKTNVESRTQQDESPLMLASLKGLTVVCQQLKPGGFVINRAEARRLSDQQRPPRAVLRRDLATFRGNQDLAFKTPASPSLVRQFKPRQDTRQLVDGKRDSVRTGFPVMPGPIRDLKIFPRSLDRPAQLEASVAQAKAKLGAGLRVMGAGFAVFGTVTVLHTMYMTTSC